MTFTLIEAEAYANELARLIPKAQKRIALAAMIIMSGPKTDDMLQPLVAAAKRGVRVHALYDRFSGSAAAKPSNVDMSEFKQAVAATYALFDELKAAGGTVTPVGTVGLNPYSGRYHAKVSIVDDDIFSFGGVNMRDDAFDTIDYMLHATDAKLADDLEHLLQQNAQGEPPRDVQLLLPNGDMVLFDAGQKGESIIFRRACDLAARARSATYVSQMAPTGKLAKALAKTKTTYFANRPSQTGLRPATLAQWLDQRTNGLENHYEGQPYIHAKFILYELLSGEKALLSGSHNFSWRGVAFGTKEIALESTDEKLWHDLQAIVYKVATAD